MKSTVILTVLLTTMAGLQYNNANAQQKTETRSIMISNEGESQISTTEDGHRYRMKLNGSKLTELYVDDKKIAEEDFSKYDSLVKRMLVQIEKDRKQAEKDRAQAEIDRQQADKDRERADLDRKQAEKDRLVAEEDRKRADLDRARADEDRKEAEKDRAQADLDRKQADKDRVQADLDRKQADKDRKLVDDMLNELVTEKIIEDRDAIKSLTLDNNELSVNGTKQSPEIHSRFKKKYLKDSQSQIKYQNSEGFRGMTITQQ